MDDFKSIIEKILEFRDKRDWKQFHNTKDLSLALSIEAAELNELFLWKKSNEADIKRLREELADIFIYAILISEKEKFETTVCVLSIALKLLVDASSDFLSAATTLFLSNA